jgi:hypothetical protein
MGSDGRPAAAHAHVCFAYDDPAVFAAAAADFLAEGQANGERLWFVAPHRPPAVPGSARFVAVGDAYPSGTVVDPAAQAAEYAAALDAALAAGYAGLRVAAEATSLVRTAAQLAAFTRYEHLADRLICTTAFAAMCAYDRRVLDDEAIEELAAMHARTNAEVPFQLVACPPADGQAALAGELDLSADTLLDKALDRAHLRPRDGELILNASGLRFADHRALVQLDRYADQRGATLVLRSAAGAVGRLAGLLDLPRLRVEVAR